MNAELMIEFLYIGAHAVAAAAALLFTRGWPAGRGRGLLTSALALWLANALGSVVWWIMILMSSSTSFSTGQQLILYGFRTLAFAGDALFLAFVIVMRHDLNDLRYRAEDAEAKSSLHDADEADYTGRAGPS